MSKEDIWISRIPVPMEPEADDYPRQDFNKVEKVLDLDSWNIYHPSWAPVTVAQYPSSQNRSLKFADRDPFDYAKAFRVFDESNDSLTVSFKVLPQQNDHGRFEVDLGNTTRLAPIRVSFTASGEIEVGHWKYTTVISDYTAGEWSDITIHIDVDEKRSLSTQMDLL